MSEVTKVHGDYKPVAVFDDGVTGSGAGSSTGLNAVVGGAVVQPQGPKLDFFTVTFDGAASGDDVNTAIVGLQQLATVHLYQYNANGGSDDTLAIALYPTAAWTASTIETALAGLNVSAAAGATFGTGA